jgi:predicted dithiol-disulfide oxidoreductase (DUF899 family)
LSSQGNTFKRDYHAEMDDGSQQPMLNVFHRDGDVRRTPGDGRPRIVGMT